MFTSQPLTQSLAVANTEALVSELAKLPVADARAYFIREMRGGSGKCSMSRAAIVRAVKALCDRLVTSHYQCQF